MAFPTRLESITATWLSKVFNADVAFEVESIGVYFADTQKRRGIMLLEDCSRTVPDSNVGSGPVVTKTTGMFCAGQRSF